MGPGPLHPLPSGEIRIELVVPAIFMQPRPVDGGSRAAVYDLGTRVQLTQTWVLDAGPASVLLNDPQTEVEE